MRAGSANLKCVHKPDKKHIQKSNYIGLLKLLMCLDLHTRGTLANDLYSYYINFKGNLSSEK